MANEYDATWTSGSTVPGRIKNNHSATAAPTGSNDASQGYQVRSMWIDVTNDKVYVCVDATNGSAVWEAGSVVAASTVESETTFGLSAAVGTDTEYARQDHTHGTPNADAVKSEGRWEPVQYDDGSSPWPFVYFDDAIVVAWVET